MRRAVVALAVIAVVAPAAGLLIGLPPTSLVAAPNQAVFVVPAHDGYDFGDCLTSGAPCGQIVANSWCETQGYTRALSFGPASAEDITGSVQRVSTAAPREGAVAITCGK